MRSSILLFSTLFVLAAFGCESRFVEPSPDPVASTGVPLDERMAQKARVDSRINEIEKSAEKIKRLIESFKKIQNPSSTDDVHTPLDFLLFASRELKAKIPESVKGKLVRRGTFQMPFPGLSPECKSVDTILESSSPEENNLVQQAEPEKLTYLMKTCGSDGKFLPAVEAVWTGSTLDLKINNHNLETMFKRLLDGTTQISTCQFRQDDQKILESVRCERFDVALSLSEKAQVLELSFANKGEIRLEVRAEIFENQKRKATSSIRVFENGRPEIILKPTDD